MKYIFSLAGLAVLTACADVPQSQFAGGDYRPPPANWSYRAGPPVTGIVPLVDAEVVTEEVVSLRAQRATLLNNLPFVRDPAKRAEHLRTIGELNYRAEMLEYRLRAAGLPVPR